MGSYIVKFLPLFLFAFSVSQNFTGESILRTFITLPVFIPMVIYLVKDHSKNVWGKANIFQLALGLIWLLITLYFQWTFSQLFIWIAIAFLVIKAADYFFPQFTWGITGLVLFWLNYLSINTFGVEHLLRPHLIGPSVFALLYFHSFQNRKVLIFGGLVVGHVFYALGSWEFALALFALSSIGYLLSGSSILQGWVPLFLGLGYSILFFLYLLYGVHLIQTFQ